MANQNKTAFFERYAPLAIEQQIRYGVPASITLAQMYLESGGGTSKLSVNGNNYFGIKCSREWLASGKPYSLHNDDRPNEKFCNYSSVEESVQHHSQLLMGSRYAGCRQCASDDYRGWANALQMAGYATNKQYARILVNDIETYDLGKYDRQAIETAQQRGISIGSGRGYPLDVSSQHTVNPSVARTTAGNYCYPVAGDNLIMTDGYGIGATSYRNHSHNGIDLRAKYQDVYATEDNGRIVAAGNQKGGGNYVTVEYDRIDGGKYQVSYCHLDKISVGVGDTVHAGSVLGVSGNTGNSTAPHLHLTVKYQGSEGSELKTIDPLNYLAEIAVRGNLSGTVLKRGGSEDLLSSLKGSVDTRPTPTEVLLAQQTGNMLTTQQQQNAQQGTVLAQAGGSNNERDYLSTLFAQNNDMSGGDMISSLVSSLFKSAVGLAVMFDRLNSQSISQPVSSLAEEPSESQLENQSEKVVNRQREGINVDKARDMAMVNFDTLYPENSQNHTQAQRLS